MFSLERRWLQGHPAVAHHLEQLYRENRLLTVVGGPEATGVTENNSGSVTLSMRTAEQRSGLPREAVRLHPWGALKTNPYKALSSLI